MPKATYDQAHVVISTKEGEGILQQSELMPTYREAEERATIYAEANKTETVMICKPVAIVETKTVTEVRKINEA